MSVSEEKATGTKAGPDEEVSIGREQITREGGLNGGRENTREMDMPADWVVGLGGVIKAQDTDCSLGTLVVEKRLICCSVQLGGYHGVLVAFVTYIIERRILVGNQSTLGTHLTAENMPY